jgi:hypothetical protein
MRTRIGECGVDAGMIMVGDPCYFVGKEATINERCSDWSQACKEVFCKEGNTRDTPMDVYGLGVAISTTHGDGCYPVYLETSKSGRRRLIVELD